MPDLLASFSVDVENFALITHRVPVERVAPHVPDNLELQTFDDGGGRYCFVSATCFCNERYRVTGLPYPHLTFNESTYRTYVSYNGRQGVYFIGRYLGSPIALAAQRTLARDTWLADFDLTIDESDGGYRSYVCHETSERGETSFAVTAEDEPGPRGPFGSGWDHAQFLTYRLSGLFTSSLGVVGHMPVTHPHMRCYEGTLHAGRFDLWRELGILEPDEVHQPFSVLVAPHAPFTLHPPRPAGRA